MTLCIAALKETSRMRSGAALLCFMTCRIAFRTAVNISSGSCSATSAASVYSGYSSLAEATMVPFSSNSTALVLVVPISTPIK
ncbi:hypothetical protein D1872_226450 [compost metagenome]